MNESLMQKTDGWRVAVFVADWKLTGRASFAGQVSPCGQFAIDNRVFAPPDADGEYTSWVITHLATGRRLPDLFGEREATEAETKKFVEAIAPLADWNSFDQSAARAANLLPRLREIAATI